MHILLETRLFSTCFDQEIDRYILTKVQGPVKMVLVSFTFNDQRHQRTVLVHCTPACFACIENVYKRHMFAIKSWEHKVTFINFFSYGIMAE